MLRRMKFSILMAVLMLALIGCGGESGLSDQKQNEDGTSEGVSSSGELNYAINTQPPTIDPMMSTATAGQVHIYV